MTKTVLTFPELHRRATGEKARLIYIETVDRAQINPFEFNDVAKPEFPEADYARIYPYGGSNDFIRFIRAESGTVYNALRFVGDYEMSLMAVRAYARLNSRSFICIADKAALLNDEVELVEDDYTAFYCTDFRDAWEA